MRRQIPSVLLVWLVGLVAPAVARADVGAERFVGTLVLEQGYLGNVLLAPEDAAGKWQAPSGPTIGGALRLEGILVRWVAVGLEGALTSFRIREDPALAPPVVADFDGGRHVLAGANGFVRLRYALPDGTAEYYVITGGGVGFLLHDGNDANGYGVGISGESTLGWSIFARAGVRAELVPGAGAMIELGWAHREHRGAFQHEYVDGSGAPLVRSLDYVTNQLSATVGWYLAF